MFVGGLPARQGMQVKTLCSGQASRSPAEVDVIKRKSCLTWFSCGSPVAVGLRVEGSPVVVGRPVEVWLQ